MNDNKNMKARTRYTFILTIISYEDVLKWNWKNLEFRMDAVNQNNLIL